MAIQQGGTVHPLYQIMAFVCGLTVFLLLIAGFHKEKGLKSNHKMIFLWVTFFCIQDGVWGLFASHFFHSDAGLSLMTTVYYLSASFSTFAWSVYFLSRIRIVSIRKKIYIIIPTVSLLVQIGLIVANLINPSMFFVDENGWYQTTGYRATLFYLQFATYILIGIVSFVGTARQRSDADESLLPVFFVNLAPLVFSIFQLNYPDMPANSIGFTIGCVIIELFLSRDYKEQVYTLEQVQQQLENTVTDQTEQLRRQNLELTRQAEKLTRQAEELKESKHRILDIFGAVVESRNLESGMHIQRVKEYTRILAESVMREYPEYGLTPEIISIMTAVSALHDVGKISIPDSILLKPGRLTDEEFARMKMHAVLGCEVLEHVEGVWDDDYEQMCYDICRYHHERYDGRGYPDGLIGDAIPISAQIVSVADVYDALVSERCYKKPYPLEGASIMIRSGECGIFNPKILHCFELCQEQFEATARSSC